MDWRSHIISDKSVGLGKPTIKGTRISVEFLIERLADGWTEQEILENYPKLKKDDLQAVFAYLNEYIKDGLLYDLGESAE